MVEVFKTNVKDRLIADRLIRQLQNQLPHARINFDLDDCDRILRIEGNQIATNGVTECLLILGYSCEVLE